MCSWYNIHRYLFVQCTHVHVYTYMYHVQCITVKHTFLSTSTSSLISSSSSYQNKEGDMLRTEYVYWRVLYCLFIARRDFFGFAFLYSMNINFFCHKNYSTALDTTTIIYLQIKFQSICKMFSLKINKKVLIDIVMSRYLSDFHDLDGSQLTCLDMTTLHVHKVIRYM